ncbi:hypothetical protein ACFWBN_13300 [Streptomyces sp. NPDC059989]|uniref:hypothetical protein n=1 Tax=Streptomyces sp. NPDC059989 TaxID=3347026 RepID=UPI00369D1901
MVTPTRWEGNGLVRPDAGSGRGSILVDRADDPPHPGGRVGADRRARATGH